MNTKYAYLTVDDAPSKDFSDKVDFLHQKNIPAIFFCTGENILKHQEDVAHAVKKGFIIGNHSYSHRYFSDLTLEDCRAEIGKTDKIIDETYIRSGIARPARFFRFPYFDAGGDLNSFEYEAKWGKPPAERLIYPRAEKSEAIQAFLKELGYTQPKFLGINIKWFNDSRLLDRYDVRCTFDQMEYWLCMEGAPLGMDKEEAILARIEEDFPEEGRSLNCTATSDIILIHDSEKTTELFYKIINRYIEKGICFKNDF